MKKIVSQSHSTRAITTQLPTAAASAIKTVSNGVVADSGKANPEAIKRELMTTLKSDLFQATHIDEEMKSTLLFQINRTQWRELINFRKDSKNNEMLHFFPKKQFICKTENISDAIVRITIAQSEWGNLLGELIGFKMAQPKETAAVIDKKILSKEDEKKLDLVKQKIDEVVSCLNSFKDEVDQEEFEKYFGKNRTVNDLVNDWVNSVWSSKRMASLMHEFRDVGFHTAQGPICFSLLKSLMEIHMIFSHLDPNVRHSDKQIAFRMAINEKLVALHQIAESTFSAKK